MVEAVRQLEEAVQHVDVVVGRVAGDPVVGVDRQRLNVNENLIILIMTKVHLAMVVVFQFVAVVHQLAVRLLYGKKVQILDANFILVVKIDHVAIFNGKMRWQLL